MAILLKIGVALLKGLRFAAPFLLGVAPLFIAGGTAVYGIFSWLYSFLESNISSIEDIFTACINAVNAFGSSFVSSNMGNNIAYACAIDTMLSVFATVVTIVFSVISFLTITIIAGLVGIFVKLIIGSLVSKVSKAISNTGVGVS